LKFAVSTTICKDSPLLDKLGDILYNNIHTLEVRTNQGHLPHSTLQEVKRVKAELRKRKMHVCAVHSPDEIDISSENEWTRVYSVREVQKAILVAYHLEAEICVFHPGGRGEWQQAEKSIREILEFGEEWGVVPVAETTAPGHIGGSVEDVQKLMGLFSNLRFCIDTGHTFLWGTDPAEVIEMLKDRVYHLHIDDNLGEEDDHLIPGEGKIQWRRVKGALEHIGYTGFLVYELMPAENIRSRLEEAIRNFEEVFR